jgi:hypothetical protein
MQLQKMAASEQDNFTLIVLLVEINHLLLQIKADYFVTTAESPGAEGCMWN